jgi:hypothetical protein
MFSRCRVEDLGVGVQEDSRNTEIKVREQSTHAKESQELNCLAATKPVAQRVDCKSQLRRSASIERWGMVLTTRVCGGGGASVEKGGTTAAAARS